MIPVPTFAAMFRSMLNAHESGVMSAEEFGPACWALAQPDSWCVATDITAEMHAQDSALESFKKIEVLDLYVGPSALNEGFEGASEDRPLISAIDADGSAPLNEVGSLADRFKEALTIVSEKLGVFLSSPFIQESADAVQMETTIGPDGKRVTTRTPIGAASNAKTEAEIASFRAELDDIFGTYDKGGGDKDDGDV
jgi:hypothetical protein